ncbi:alcohol dehydrogenase [Amycolatopsis mediterranei S699]|uniref:alcohol dehydrogenase (NADP(+)) n=2 Tax=Amycolatopsis mediterranei TaxID=33910 RepID=A0A0H3D6S8_AMYMU|nr:NAD(P)-dependent alcohol dehydrogenase [Amycolatopsis mediterranei]ADJ45773.1 alcohol dehydrogenase [Amycolatopsis mediterranei U32]AEK42554.1 alcohol dehydrogenase [Amycolatopsis mediterranei S699]AFO77484.1 alcohol dehydrogenase [Amycolatopsis mediterranei S699]AGT84612.1 alcohol dehydrogenase [Amycolatopsis mediterranei RB]KDO05309.1 alcohol dehydrogenase [Amycolatopsis mediterranei]
MRTTTGWLAGPDDPTLRRATLHRRDLRDDDIAIRVDHCGVCHTDLHALHTPRDAGLVPGHEFTGVVTETGPAVTRFAIGDPVAVGNIVDSCGKCPMCRRGQENFCAEFPTLTYGGTDRHDGSPTLGAYAREHVVREDFAYRLPAGLDPAAAAPLLCAGITVWEPLRALGTGPGTRVAVIGLGGLGHLAVKLAIALGAETTVISRSAGKAADASRLGARELLVSADPRQLEAARDRFDVVIDTIAVPHDLGPYLRLVALDGTLSQVGHLGSLTVEAMDLLVGRKKLTSAGSGGRPGTAAMLDFCVRHDVTADVETVPSARVNEVLDRLSAGDVRYRFVLDLADLDHADS